MLIGHKKTKGSQHESFDQTTCLFTHTERGTWKVKSGTGAYSDAKGGGTYRLIVQGFSCGDTEPTSFYQHVTAGGKLSY